MTTTIQPIKNRLTSLFSSTTRRDSPKFPFWLSVLSGLPISMCMAIMGLPDISETFRSDFRILFLCTFLFWIFPLAYLQRRLWRSRVAWWLMSLILLVATYAMSVINNGLGMELALKLGLIKKINWNEVFSGLDGCWLAFVGFCAIHAVLTYYFALDQEKIRTAAALSQAREAQLRALRYQLHPHFLFNTLNAISALVTTDRNREATRMISHLGDFLRATLENEHCHEHALADELALTENYLDIEKARLGNRLDIAIHIGPDVFAAYVPYLFLQPLMENAIRHGIAPNQHGGRVELTVERDGEQLHIRLINDTSSNSEALKSHSCGVGLRNVMERLENLYPNQHQFAISSNEQGKFSVSIALPYCNSGTVKQTWSQAA